MRDRKKKPKMINAFLDDLKKYMNELKVSVNGVDAKMDYMRWLN
jgi:hypothetical protein